MNYIQSNTLTKTVAIKCIKDLKISSGSLEYEFTEHIRCEIVKINEMLEELSYSKQEEYFLQGNVISDKMKQHIRQRWGEVFYRMYTELETVKRRDFVCMHIATYVRELGYFISGAIAITKYADDTVYGIFSEDPSGVHIAVGYPQLGVYYFNECHMLKEGSKSYKFTDETAFQCGVLDTVNEPVYVQVDWDTGSIIRMEMFRNIVS